MTSQHPHHGQQSPEAAETMDRAAVQAVADLHPLVPPGWCGGCAGDYPCLEGSLARTTLALMDDLDATNARLQSALGELAVPRKTLAELREDYL